MICRSRNVAGSRKNLFIDKNKNSKNHTFELQTSQIPEISSYISYLNITNTNSLQEFEDSAEYLQPLSLGEDSDLNLLNQSSGDISMKYKINQISNKPSFQQEINKLNTLLNQKDPDDNDIINILYQINIISLSKKTGFLRNLNELSDQSLKEKIFETVVIRIDGSLANTTDSTDKFYLNKFKIISLGKQAEAIEKQYLQEQRPEIKLEKFKKVIKLYDDANIMCNKFLNKDIKDNPEEIFQNKVFSIISNYTSENPEHAYELASQSLAARNKYLTTESSNQIAKIEDFYPSLLLSMISLPYVANKTYNESLKLKALVVSEQAYNMCHLHGVNLEYLAQILKNMADLNRYFGDHLKANVQDKHAKDIVSCDSEGNEKKDHNNIYAISNKNSPIIIAGFTTQEIIDVKQAIQEKILKPISEAAANGKWQEKSLIGNYGAGGYLTEDYIKLCLGPDLAGESNVKIALMLAFEAINLGIMNSESKNPTCAMHFVIRHPDITKEIIKHHPDFFVSSYIFRNTIKDSHEYSKDLFGYKLDQNGEYNKFFEASITPFVLGRLQENVYNPLFKLVSADLWSDAIKDKMLHYIDDSYLTSGMVNSNLGSNLGDLPDILNIVRILAFKTINDALKAKGDPNYSPVNAFAEKYLYIVERIHKEATDSYHPTKIDYFANNAVVRICETKIARAKQVEAMKSISTKEFANDSLEQSQVNQKPLEYKVPDKVDFNNSDLFQSVLHFSNTIANQIETLDDIATLGEGAL